MGRWAVLALGGGLAVEAGCADVAPETDLVWWEGLRYGWEAFNHRLSYLRAGVAEGRGEVAVIGGTSTTGALTELAEGCRPGCEEFPLVDHATIRLGYGTADAAPVVVGYGRADLVAGAEETTATIAVRLSEEVRGPLARRGEAIALLQGLSWDGGVPLADGSLCYPPRNGWPPTRLAVVLSDPEIEGDRATVEVRARFEAGRTLEEDRACLDLAAPAASARFGVEVLVVVGLDREVHEVRAQASYPWSGDRIHPEEQLALEPLALPLSPAHPILGWQALDWTFHREDPDGRGAYLRTLGAEVDGSGRVTVVASNYSPGTQLSGFDFAFRGVVAAVDGGHQVHHHVFEGSFPAELDQAGTPVVHRFDL